MRVAQDVERAASGARGKSGAQDGTRPTRGSTSRRGDEILAAQSRYIARSDSLIIHLVPAHLVQLFEDPAADLNKWPCVPERPLGICSFIRRPPPLFGCLKDLLLMALCSPNTKMPRAYHVVVALVLSLDEGLCEPFVGDGIRRLVEFAQQSKGLGEDSTERVTKTSVVSSEERGGVVNEKAHWFVHVVEDDSAGRVTSVGGKLGVSTPLEILLALVQPRALRKTSTTAQAQARKILQRHCTLLKIALCVLAHRLTDGSSCCPELPVHPHNLCCCTCPPDLGHEVFVGKGPPVGESWCSMKLHKA